MGGSHDDLTFRTFKQWACEGKILMAHSRLIQRSLHLSDTASNTFDVTILLYFIYYFKTVVWKARCVNQVKWELEYKISQKQKCSHDLDTTNDKEETHLDIVNEGQWPVTNPLYEQTINNDPSSSSHVQVLDDIASPIRSVPIRSNSIQDKILRKWEVAHLTWMDMTTYIKHNYTSDWMPRMSKYLNKFTKLSDELWDDSANLGDW